MIKNVHRSNIIKMIFIIILGGFCVFALYATNASKNKEGNTFYDLLIGIDN